MRFKGQRESKNIEDQRGAPPPVRWMKGMTVKAQASKRPTKTQTPKKGAAR